MLKYEKDIKASSSLSSGLVPQPKAFTVSFWKIVKKRQKRYTSLFLLCCYFFEYFFPFSNEDLSLLL